MINDTARTDTYVEALRQVVEPGSVVVDIGTGTGLFAIKACQFGARKVYAIEVSNIISLAKQIAVDNHCADKIEFIQELSSKVDLPERVDVVVADLHGSLPMFGNSLKNMTDARKRFLKPGGVMIPAMDSLWAVVLESPGLYQSIVNPWVDNSYGLDMTAGRKMATNNMLGVDEKAPQMLSDNVCWGEIDYSTVSNPNVEGQQNLTVTRDGTGHGIKSLE